MAKGVRAWPVSALVPDNAGSNPVQVEIYFVVCPQNGTRSG